MLKVPSGTYTEIEYSGGCVIFEKTFSGIHYGRSAFGFFLFAF